MKKSIISECVPNMQTSYAHTIVDEFKGHNEEDDGTILPSME